MLLKVHKTIAVISAAPFVLFGLPLAQSYMSWRISFMLLAFPLRKTVEMD